MIKCYHVRRVELVVYTEPQLFYEGPIVSPLIATIDSDKEPLEDIWDCCNNGCWWRGKDFRKMKTYKDQFKVRFTNNYSGFCNDDLIVEMNGVFHISLSFGWKTFKTFNGAVKYLKTHARWCQIYGVNSQHPTAREHTMSELMALKSHYENIGNKTRIIRDAK